MFMSTKDENSMIKIKCPIENINLKKKEVSLFPKTIVDNGER